MSDLLLQWLNEDLKLSKRISNIEQYFSNGYHFGEVLHFFNHQEDWNEFVDTSRDTLKIRNFCRLYPVLRRINAQINAQDAIAIILEEPGAAANVLYRIKVHFEQLKHLPSVSCKAHSFANIRTRMAKPIADQSDKHTFESILRRDLPTTDFVSKQIKLRDGHMQTKSIWRSKKRKEEESLKIIRQEHLHTMRIDSQIRQNADKSPSDAWRLGILKKNEREKRQAAFVRRNAKKRDFYKNERIARTQNETEQYLRSFESEKRKALDTPHCLQFQPNPNESDALKTESFSETLERQKIAKMRMNEERHRRIGIFGQSCVHTLSRENEENFASLLRFAGNQLATEERDCLQKAKNALSFRSAARENRRKRERRYRFQYSLDQDQARARNDLSFTLLFRRFHDELELQNIFQGRRDVSKRSNKLFLYKSFVQELIDLFVSVAVLVAEHRKHTLLLRQFEKDSMPRLLEQDIYDDCVNICRRHVALPSRFSMLQDSDEDVSEELLSSLSDDRYMTFIAHEELDDRSIRWEGDDQIFCGFRRSIPGACMLGEAIKYARYVTMDVSKNKSQASQLQLETEESIQMLVIGDEYIAKYLGSRLQCSVILLQTFMENALQQSTAIGKQIQASLCRGEEIASHYYGALAAEAIAQRTSNARWILHSEYITFEQLCEMEKQIFKMEISDVDHDINVHVSKLAPGIRWKACAERHEMHGFDLILHVDRPVKDQFHQCFGQLRNSETHEEYHLFQSIPCKNMDYQRLEHSGGAIMGTYTLALEEMKTQCANLKEYYKPMGNFIHLYAQTKDEMSLQCMQSLAESKTIDFFQRKWTAQNENRREEMESKLLHEEEWISRTYHAIESRLQNTQADIHRYEEILRDSEEWKGKKEKVLDATENLNIAKQEFDAAMELASQRMQLDTKVESSMLDNPQAIYEAIALVWNDMETLYEQDVKSCFTALLHARRECYTYINQAMDLLSSRHGLFRPDMKQYFANAFRKQFNSVLDDMRCDSRTKEELHGRTDALHDQLETIVMNEREKNIGIMDNALKGEFFESFLHLLAQIRQMMLHAECQRFYASVLVLYQALGCNEEFPSLQMHNTAAETPLVPVKEKSKSQMIATNTASDTIEAQAMYDAIVEAVTSRIEVLGTKKGDIASDNLMRGMQCEVQGSRKRVHQVHGLLDQQTLLVQRLSNATEWKMKELIDKKEQDENVLSANLIACIRYHIEDEQPLPLLEIRSSDDVESIIAYTEHGESLQILSEALPFDSVSIAKKQLCAMFEKALEGAQCRRMHLCVVKDIYKRFFAQRLEFRAQIDTLSIDLQKTAIANTCENIPKCVKIDPFLSAIAQDATLFSSI